jgi:5-methyltetrahydropteroyltriglutamate--homocysteine methyltransferase
MIGSYVTGILPRSQELVELTRAYEREKVTGNKLEMAFDDATAKAIKVQESAGLTYITDGMLRWQDMLRPFTENLSGVKAGSLARWFNNNTFYRKPVIVGDIERKRSITGDITRAKFLPKNLPWKAVLPAPYTFVRLSENHFYKNGTEFMFKYAEMLNEEIKSLEKLGFKYVQLSDPALVYRPFGESISRQELKVVSEALKVAVEGIDVKTCLQTFFGDFSQALPEALEFPVDHLGIDLYETNVEKLKEHSFDKGVALGLVDARSSLVENTDDLVKVARETIESIHGSNKMDVFVCPNCDLEFLPWERALEKMKVVGDVAKRLGEEAYG